MKKTLIALAAVAVSTGAMAQNVTIGGLVDFSAVDNTKTTTQSAANASVTTKAQTTGAQNTWTTGQISISGSEDLGGGLRASFTLNSTIAGGNFMDRDRNLALSGGFGTVRIGRFVPAAAMGFHGYSGAASAATGSIYGVGSTSTRIAAINATNAMMTGGSFERNDNQIQYTSPNVNGFTVNVNYGSNSSDTGGVVKTVTKQQGIGATYVAGPLSIGAGVNERERSSVAAVTASATVGGLAANTKGQADLNWIGASYNLGVATVFATNVNRKDKAVAANGTTTTQADISVNAMGVSVPMGAITINASTYSGKNKQTVAADDNMKLSGHQLSVRYALSKRTTVYALVGENKIARDGAAAANETRKETRNMVGLLHSF